MGGVIVVLGILGLVAFLAHRVLSHKERQAVHLKIVDNKQEEKK